MNGKLTFEVPAAEAIQFESLLDEWLVLLRQMAADRARQEQEAEEYRRRFRTRMDAIWARLEDVARNPVTETRAGATARPESIAGGNYGFQK